MSPLAVSILNSLKFSKSLPTTVTSGFLAYQSLPSALYLSVPTFTSIVGTLVSLNNSEPPNNSVFVLSAPSWFSNTYPTAPTGTSYSFPAS